MENCKGHIVFDHDGTLVDTSVSPYKLIPSMREFLEELKNEGYELYVWTARSHYSTLESLRDCGIIHLFSEIYGHDDGMSKPHPMGLQKLVGEFDRAKIIHIGDSITDIRGAKEFKIDVIAACWTDPSAVSFFAKYTELVAANLVDCKKIIDRKFNKV